MQRNAQSTAQFPHVFVVENHPDTLKALRGYLEVRGHKVSSASTMQEALQMLPDSDAKVLICDIGLPDGDGWELLKTARLSRPVFAIAMSGFGQNADRAKSEAAGFRYHLLKPFSVDEVDRALDQAAMEQQ